MPIDRKIIFPYKMGSVSARALSEELGGVRVYPDRNYRPRSTDLIINWGNSHTPNWMNRAIEVGARILNQPNSVALASNKLFTLANLRNTGVSVPRFTTDKDEANYTEVVVRHILNAHSGEGIEIYEDEELPDAPLYTEFIPQRAEYRVHVFNGRVISYAKKKMRTHDEDGNDIEVEADPKIRSHDNGWVFTRENLRRLERVEQLAISAVNALNLDFGGVDIVRGHDNQCYVLEVNSACGLEGQTLDAYVNAINEYATIQ